MNPLTPLTAAVCAVVVVMIAHDTVVSAVMLAFAVVTAVLSAVLSGGAGRSTGRRSSRQLRALGASLLLTVPATVSYALIYVPFSAEGWTTAGGLSLRFAAMTASGLVLLSFVDVDDLMCSLQLRVPAPLVYMVGSVVRLLSMARRRWSTIREVQRSRGVPDTWRARASCVLPLVVGLVVEAGHRSRPLQRTGIGDPGPRTLLDPVDDPWQERVGRRLLVLVPVFVAVTVLW